MDNGKRTKIKKFSQKSINFVKLPLFYQVETRLEIPRYTFGIAIRGNWLYISGGLVTRNGKEERSNEFGKINLVTGERAKLSPMQQDRTLLYLCNGE